VKFAGADGSVYRVPRTGAVLIQLIRLNLASPDTIASVADEPN